MQKLRVGIAGATGYAGEELIRLLLQHPEVQLTSLASSAKWVHPTPASAVFPRFARSLDLPVESLDPARLIATSDCVFLALPHGTAMGLVPQLLDSGKRVVDLSGDFRLRDAALYPRWYEFQHAHPALLGEAAYGLSELFQDDIRTARLVANPGCYATSVILVVAPLVQASLIEPNGLIIDAKSGRTGAGRETVSVWEQQGRLEDLWPYKVNGHQHAPEVEQALGRFDARAEFSITFVPHVVPMDRGILSTIYLRTVQPLGWNEVHRVYDDAYGRRQAPFIRLLPEGSWPEIRKVVGTNYCDLGFTVDQDKRLVIVVAAIDNLIKGAAGQAIQNCNLMYGFPETTGLL